MCVRVSNHILIIKEVKLKRKIGDVEWGSIIEIPVKHLSENKYELNKDGVKIRGMLLSYQLFSLLSSFINFRHKTTDGKFVTSVIDFPYGGDTEVVVIENIDDILKRV